MKKKSTIVFLISFLLICLFIVGYFQVNQKETVKTKTQESVAINGKVTAKIIMQDDKYTPNEVTIKAGEAIIFVNKSSSNRWPASNIHPSHELYPEFDPKRELKPGESWTFTFKNTGKWRMHDHLAPYIKGIITVE